MLKTILYTLIFILVIITIGNRDKEHQAQWEQRINLCNETGKHCPKHLRGE